MRRGAELAVVRDSRGTRLSLSKTSAGTNAVAVHVVDQLRGGLGGIEHTYE